MKLQNHFKLGIFVVKIKLIVLLILFRTGQSQTSDSQSSSSNQQYDNALAENLCQMQLMSCPSMCCDKLGKCSQDKSNCFISKCIDRQCYNGCCHEGMCGSQSDCKQTQLVIAVVLTVCLGVSTAACFILCILAVIRRCKNKHGAVMQDNQQQVAQEVDYFPQVLNIEDVHNSKLTIMNKKAIPFMNASLLPSLNDQKSLKNQPSSHQIQFQKFNIPNSSEQQEDSEQENICGQHKTNTIQNLLNQNKHAIEKINKIGIPISQEDSQNKCVQELLQLQFIQNSIKQELQTQNSTIVSQAEEYKPISDKNNNYSNKGIQKKNHHFTQGFQQPGQKNNNNGNINHYESEKSSLYQSDRSDSQYQQQQSTLRQNDEGSGAYQLKNKKIANNNKQFQVGALKNILSPDMFDQQKVNIGQQLECNENKRSLKMNAWEIDDFYKNKQFKQGQQTFAVLHNEDTTNASFSQQQQTTVNNMLITFDEDNQNFKYYHQKNGNDNENENNILVENHQEKINQSSDLHELIEKQNESLDQKKDSADESSNQQFLIDDSSNQQFEAFVEQVSQEHKLMNNQIISDKSEKNPGIQQIKQEQFSVNQQLVDFGCSDSESQQKVQEN